MEIFAKIEAADVDLERERLRRLLEAMPDDKARVAYCVERATDDRDGPQALVTRFLHAQAALACHAREGVLSRSEVDRLVTLAHKLLQLARIKPSSSRLAFLYADLYETLALIHEGDGDRWGQIWEFQRAQLLSRKASRTGRDEQILTTARALFREGNGQVAGELVALAGRSEEPWLRSLRRLRGDSPGGESGWDEAWTAAVAARDPSRLFVIARREKGVKTRTPFIDLWLWTRAAAQTKLFEESGLPGLRQLRKNAEDEAFDAAAYAVAGVLEALYDAERPLDQRVAAAREILTLARKARTVERELLCLAALARWLVRFNQMDLAIATLARYRELARGASAGWSEDPFGVLADLSVATLAGRYRRSVPYAAESDFSKKQGERLLELGLLGAKVSSLMMKGALKSWFTEDGGKSQVKVETETEIANTVVNFLSRRKGALLKIGQVCSYFSGPIAQHVSEQAAVLQAEVAAMPPPLMRKVFQRELGKLPEEVFAAFDEQPFAAGSIGQVHRAVTKDGRQVAVKIRYENVREIIEIEFRTMRRGRAIFTRMLPLLNWDELLDEIRTHLLYETDYLREKAQIEFFRGHFGKDPDVYIPAVVPELSTAGVLTTELAAGRTFEEFVATATAEERDRAGETIARVLLTSNFGLGRFNADPQPGNFLFDDGRVIFIDFGCVKEFSPVYLEERQRANRAFFQRDLETMGDAYVKQGYVDDIRDIVIEDVWNFYKKVNAHALRNEPYQVEAGFGADVFRAFSLDNPHRAKLKVPVDSFFSSRIEFGLMSVLHRLGARINYHRIVMPLLFPGGDYPEPLDEDPAA